MKTLFEDQNLVQSKQGFGPDPILYRKKGLSDSLNHNISDYREKLKDKHYIHHAIDKIAVELMHFLVK